MRRGELLERERGDAGDVAGAMQPRDGARLVAPRSRVGGGGAGHPEANLGEPGVGAQLQRPECLRERDVGVSLVRAGRAVGREAPRRRALPSQDLRGGARAPVGAVGEVPERQVSGVGPRRERRAVGHHVRLRGDRGRRTGTHPLAAAVLVRRRGTPRRRREHLREVRDEPRGEVPRAHVRRARRVAGDDRAEEFVQLGRLPRAAPRHAPLHQRGVLGGSQSRVLMTRGRDHELEPPAPARARERRFVSREDFQRAPGAVRGGVVGHGVEERAVG